MVVKLSDYLTRSVEFHTLSYELFHFYVARDSLIGDLFTGFKLDSMGNECVPSLS